MPADDMRERLAAIIDELDDAWSEDSAAHGMTLGAYAAPGLLGWMSDEHAAEVVRLTEQRDGWAARLVEFATMQQRAERAEARIAAARALVERMLFSQAQIALRAALADEQPAAEPAWRDRHGDVWTKGPDGLMHSRETAPFPREHVERKWGPLVAIATPEPPHLDPEPFTSRRHPGASRYPWSFADNPHVIFAPRPADEQGRPYSQRREDYEGER